MEFRNDDHASYNRRHESRTLDHGMLLGARRMFEWYVGDRAVATDEVRALTMNV